MRPLKQPAPKTRGRTCGSCTTCIAVSRKGLRASSCKVMPRGPKGRHDAAGRVIEPYRPGSGARRTWPQHSAIHVVQLAKGSHPTRSATGLVARCTNLFPSALLRHLDPPTRLIAARRVSFGPVLTRAATCTTLREHNNLEHRPMDLQDQFKVLTLESELRQERRTRNVMATLALVGWIVALAALGGAV